MKRRVTAIASIRRILCGVSLCVLLSGMIPAYAAHDTPMIHAGYRTLSSSLPSERLMLHIGVWYPSTRRPGTVKLGEWTFRAARNAAIIPGPWPVIVLSHDVTGSAWAHHDLAAALAARGYIVVAPTHDHSHAEDMSLFLTQEELPLRAIQLKAALDLVLAHPQLGAEADGGRVGFLGFGTPSAAGLLLGGGRMDTSLWPTFCASPSPKDTLPISPDPSVMIPSVGEASAGEEKPASMASASSDGSHSSTGADRPFAAIPFGSESPWCSPILKPRIDQLTASIENGVRERADKKNMRQAAEASREQSFRKLEDAISRTHQRQMRMAKTSGLPVPPVIVPLLPPLSEERTLSDERFRALAFVSPGLSMLFSQESLADMRVPSLFVGAGKDRWNLPSEQAERFTALLGMAPRYLLLPDVDSPAFQAACPESDPALPLDALCRSVTPEIRSATRARMLSELDSFFSQALKR